MREENLLGRRAAELAHQGEADADGIALDLLDAGDVALVDGVAGPDGVLADHQVGHPAPDVAVLVLGKVEQGAPQGGRIAHQRADHPEAVGAVPETKEKAEVGAAGPLGAELQHQAGGDEGDAALPVCESVGGEPGSGDHLGRIDPQLTEERRHDRERPDPLPAMRHLPASLASCGTFITAVGNSQDPRCRLA